MVLPAPQFSVKVNGVMDPLMFGYITEVVVDTNIFIPSMCTITLEDSMNTVGLTKFVDNALLYRLGAPLEVSAKTFDRK
ncbi:MAG TPA: hypothetical protein VFM46_01785, partial [Pseudomonadales bacterium]|nr:hypothetical protein [Pseudomonadales bacterium]